MYESHFQLRQAPFSIAPDPEFLYLSDGHREAFAHLTYGLSQGGFVLITGEVGTGKTTLLRNMLKQMPADVEVAFILNPRLTVRELLETICDELGIDYSKSDRSSVKTYIDALNAHLLETHARGRSTVVIIDEAQNLAPAVLEQIRLLTNLETDKRKLLRVMLLGQPELLELLARKELRQLAQRITARYHLRGLSRDETFAYVVHRLQRAGGSALIFTRPALYRLYRLSGGIPRLINLIADRALLGTYAEGRHRVGWRMIGRAAREVLGQGNRAGRWIGAGVASAVLVGLVAAWLLYPNSPRPGLSESGPGPAATPTPAPAPGPTQNPAGGSAASTPAPRVPTAVDSTAPADITATAAPTIADAPARTDGTSAPPGPVVAPESTASGATAPPYAESLAATSDATTGEAMTDAAMTEEATTDEAITNDGIAGAGAATAASAATVAPIAAASALVRPEMTTFQSQRLAYQAAFSRWGADFSTASLSTIPCDFAPSAGLQCLGGTGTWNDLRRLNLPVVLELWDAGSTPFYGALVAMSGDQVTLSVGGSEFQFDIASLANNWFGGYVLLWQTPPGYIGSLKQGDHHPSVGWVREQLESLELAVPGAPDHSSDRDAFDTGLHEAVMRFQESEAMVPDGVVGPLTWIRLAHRLGLRQPGLGG